MLEDLVALKKHFSHNEPLTIKANENRNWKKLSFDEKVMYKVALALAKLKGKMVNLTLVQKIKRSIWSLRGVMW
jgi:hypothetical protein